MQLEWCCILSIVSIVISVGFAIYCTCCLRYNKRRIGKIGKIENEEALSDEDRAEAKALYDNMYDSITSNETHFEAKITYISAGGVGLMFAYMSSLGEHITHKWMLITGVASLILTLFVNLISYMASKYLTRKVIKRYDGFLSSGKWIPENINSQAVELSKKIDRWNLASVFFLLIGILTSTLFVVFSIKNG